MYEKKSQKETMPHQRKLDSPICNHPRLTNSSDHLIHSHNISGKERKTLLQRARFSVLSGQPEQPHPSIPQSDSTPAKFGNSLSKTSPLPGQNKLPNPIPSNSTSYENEDELIPCPHILSRISYAGINFIHNHSLAHPRGFAQKNLPPLWGFCILAFAS